MHYSIRAIDMLFFHIYCRESPALMKYLDQLGDPQKQPPDPRRLEP